MSKRYLKQKQADTHFPSHQSYMTRSRFAGLDGLRGLAVIGTVFVHAPQGAMWSFLNGQFGVMAFFILSGFLITTLLLRENQSLGHVNYRSFLVRRSFRLFPIYYGILIIYAVKIFGLGMTSDTALAKQTLLRLVFYVQEFGILNFYYQSWSLGIEEKFYFIWPLIVFKLTRNIPTAFKWLGIYATLITGLYLYLPFDSAWSHPSLVMSYSSLLTGTLVAVLLHHHKTYRLVIPLLNRFEYVILTLFLINHFGFNLSHNGKIANIGLFAALLTTIVSGGSLKTVRFLESPILSSIGKYSYFIYLFHLLAQDLVLKILPHFTNNERTQSLFAIICTILLSYAAATVSFRYFEEPLIKLGRRLSAHLAKERTPGPPKVALEKTAA